MKFKVFFPYFSYERERDWQKMIKTFKLLNLISRIGNLKFFFSYRDKDRQTETDRQTDLPGSSCKMSPVLHYSVVYIFWSFVILNPLQDLWKFIWESLVRPNWLKLTSLARKDGHFRNFQFSVWLCVCACVCAHCSQGSIHLYPVRNIATL